MVISPDTIHSATIANNSSPTSSLLYWPSLIISALAASDIVTPGPFIIFANSFPIAVLNAGSFLKVLYSVACIISWAAVLIMPSLIANSLFMNISVVVSGLPVSLFNTGLPFFIIGTSTVAPRKSPSFSDAATLNPLLSISSTNAFPSLVLPSLMFISLPFSFANLTSAVALAIDWA